MGFVTDMGERRNSYKPSINKAEGTRLARET
jgi:hypothetical protein